ncbi:MAG: polysaccharide deacetylase family protein [Clostridia bacterium]|nr:polysaccharide deacetylase family protein [Clostridia bacterium]
MKKGILFVLLTVLAIYVIIICVDARSGDLFISDNNPANSGENINKGEVFDSSGDGEIASRELISSGEEESQENDNREKNEDILYNESGRIIIAMYHKFSETEGNDEWGRSFDNFYEDLKYLYEHHYRTVSLNDYLNHTMKVPVGCTPIILTFDDGYSGQFNLILNEEGELVANPKSAVGVMEKFYAEYPEFGLNGTFYINSTGFFGNVGTNSQKLNYLIEKGFEIGNHTSTHVNFSKASLDTVQKEVGTVANLVREAANGYEITSLALPYGISSKEYKSYIAEGEYEGQKYKNNIILLVGAEPAYPSQSEKCNLLSLPRVRARGGNKAVDYDLYYWLDKMEKNPNMKYERIS